MTTRFDDGPEFDPDDPLAVLLRPPSDHLGPPPGRYEAIRRAATRRRLLCTAAGVGVSCAVAALIALPLHLAAPETPRSPTVPLAPPPASGPATPPPSTPSPSRPPSTRPEPATPRPTTSPLPDEPGTPTSPALPTQEPSVTPTSARVEP
ncbi:hypothetical protein ACFV7R_17670 [Streptomyces sp. NPDC059866]|uniref:hypothetical protein n=1 Tax=Streptomyces sp. NPDC059866 TaxID=3346978 RepID=UPI00365BBD2E